MIDSPLRVSIGCLPQDDDVIVFGKLHRGMQDWGTDGERGIRSRLEVTAADECPERRCVRPKGVRLSQSWYDGFPFGSVFLID